MSDATKIVQLLDLNGYKGQKDGTLWFNEREVPRGEMCFYATPWSAPAYTRWMRIVDKVKNTIGPKPEVPALICHTMELDCYGFGVKVYVRFGMDNTLKVIIEDADGRDTVAEYRKD